ncbi:hypothetical protein HNY73_021564 [Argiope bruennichi]|uniref:Uncharacterized protein n=1 Tax=Argiope bruennichi TaxID=94029 RepID=A0A8T0DYT1_ARGBR|nr:hypothetical protein HNY73_021564 [Argiope bruennichi]
MMWAEGIEPRFALSDTMSLSQIFRKYTPYCAAFVCDSREQKFEEELEAPGVRKKKGLKSGITTAATSGLLLARGRKPMGNSRQTEVEDYRPGRDADERPHGAKSVDSFQLRLFQNVLT